MSAILSAEDLNDFISPGVACIKPVETLPQQIPTSTENAYEVTTEDKLPVEAAPAQISLTDCLACSGCVTSAEAVLVSLQSHAEVLNALDSNPAFTTDEIRQLASGDLHNETKRIFVASISPQVRASLAVTYGTSEQEAGHMIEQLLCGPYGLSIGGAYGNSFAWTIDTNAMREVCLDAGAGEVLDGASSQKPILASACPGWVCYAEKTHPHVLPHLSRLKSPQALTGILLKTVLSKKLQISPSQIFHVAIMPCFDKKLEGSRQELTNKYWQAGAVDDATPPVRDVDCVITAREILMLAESRGISYPSLPRTALSKPPFPDKSISSFLFPTSNQRHAQSPEAGTSGGYLHHILLTAQSSNPGSTLTTTRGRNADVIDYTLTHNNKPIFRAARYYGFRNIQNLVRKLKPPKLSKLSGRTLGARKPPGPSSTSSGSGSGAAGSLEYNYVEVMACPGGCTNGGGQIKFDDLGALQSMTAAGSQKEWLGLVDEAYYSMEEEEDRADAMNVDGQEVKIKVKDFVEYWSTITGISVDMLLYTSFRAVVSDVGKNKKGDVERVAEIATKMGGGW